MQLKQYLKNCDFLFFVGSGIIASQIILLSSSINETILIPFINNNIIYKFKNKNKINNKNNKELNKEIEEEIIEELKEYNIEKLIYSFIQIIITILLMKLLYKYMLNN